jgi:hypothetical protein
MKQETGGPAFPTVDANRPEDYGTYGITMRDYFAAKAPSYTEKWFIKYCQNRGYISEAKTIADWSYVYADAMLEARK